MLATIIATLAAVGLLVGALAVYLIVIAATLRQANSAVARIRDNLLTVAEKATPLGPAIEALNEALEGVRDQIDDLRRPLTTTGRGRRRRRS